MLRRSLSRTLLISSLFTYAIYSDEQHSNNNLNYGNSWYHYQEQLKAAQEAFNNNQSQANNQALNPQPEPLDSELRTLIMQMADDEIKKLLLLLKDRSKNLKENIDVCPTNVLFVGSPGVGKTTLAQAIAEEANVNFISINAPFIADKYKNSGPENLKIIFNDLLTTQKPTLVAIDEINSLTNSHQNINNPDSNTADALWLLLDLCVKNKNLIIVGILNDDSKMPPQLKSRYASFTYRIKSKNENANKQIILNHYLKKYPHECTLKCEQRIVKLLKTAEARSIEGITKRAAGNAAAGKKEWKITEKDLEKALSLTDATRKAQEKIEPTQAEKTLRAQERAANSTFALNMTLITGTVGTAAHKIVEYNYGSWTEAWNKWAPAVGEASLKVAISAMYTAEVAAKIYMGNKVPTFKDFAEAFAKNKIQSDLPGKDFPRT